MTVFACFTYLLLTTGEAAAARAAHAQALKEADAARYVWMARRLSEEGALYGV